MGELASPPEALLPTGQAMTAPVCSIPGRQKSSKDLFSIYLHGSAHPYQGYRYPPAGRAGRRPHRRRHICTPREKTTVLRGKFCTSREMEPLKRPTVLYREGNPFVPPGKNHCTSREICLYSEGRIFVPRGKKLPLNYRPTKGFLFTQQFPIDLQHIPTTTIERALSRPAVAAGLSGRLACPRG
jgi:hypothetical protein